MRAVEVARNDVDIVTSDERADSAAEWLHYAIGRARAIGKQNQNVAGRCEQFVAEAHRMADICAARERQRVAEHGCDPAAETRLKKVVARRCAENVAETCERKCRSQTNGIKMTRMVCHDDERLRAVQVFRADDFEAQIDAHRYANNHRDD